MTNFTPNIPLFGIYEIKDVSSETIEKLNQKNRLILDKILLEYKIQKIEHEISGLQLERILPSKMGIRLNENGTVRDIGEILDQTKFEESVMKNNDKIMQKLMMAKIDGSFR